MECNKKNCIKTKELLARAINLLEQYDILDKKQRRQLKTALLRL